MAVAIVTGSAGLIGSDAVRFFAQQGFDVVGIDNDMRKYFFGSGASTNRNRRNLEQTVAGYSHSDLDIRDKEAIEQRFPGIRRISPWLSTRLRSRHMIGLRLNLTQISL